MQNRSYYVESTERNTNNDVKSDQVDLDTRGSLSNLLIDSYTIPYSQLFVTATAAEAIIFSGKVENYPFIVFRISKRKLFKRII